jgi:hypothetical protein
MLVYQRVGIKMRCSEDVPGTCRGEISSQTAPPEACWKLAFTVSKSKLGSPGPAGPAESWVDMCCNLVLDKFYIHSYPRLDKFIPFYTHSYPIIYLPSKIWLDSWNIHSFAKDQQDRIHLVHLFVPCLGGNIGTNFPTHKVLIVLIIMRPPWACHHGDPQILCSVRTELSQTANEQSGVILDLSDLSFPQAYWHFIYTGAICEVIGQHWSTGVGMNQAASAKGTSAWLIASIPHNAAKKNTFKKIWNSQVNIPNHETLPNQPCNPCKSNSWMWYVSSSQTIDPATQLTPFTSGSLKTTPIHSPEKLAGK